MKIEDLISQRIRNQLRIHWMWLKKKEDYNEIADFIDFCIKQVTNKIKSKEVKNDDKR